MQPTAAKRPLTLVFLAILVVFLSLLLMRVWMGPLGRLVSVRSTLNVEAIAFLALCLCLLTRHSRSPSPHGPSSNDRAGLGLIFAIGVASAAAYIPGITCPFLFDDYRHLMFAVNETWRELLSRVVLNHPTGGDLFFRPLGDFAILALYDWAHFDFRLWHVAGTLTHVVNTLLVLLLAKRICGSWFGAAAASLFFGWQASHVEAVNWLSAFYDLLATFFVLLVLLETTSRKSSAWRYAGLCLATVLACLSKESAFCLPFLASIVTLFKSLETRRLAWKKTLASAAACAFVFLFRFWYLGGLGGYYQSTEGSSAIHLHAPSVLQALGLRLWAILFVPLNWSAPPGLPLKLAFSGLAVAAVGFSLTAQLIPRRAVLLLLFTIFASLPAIAVLLIGPDLAGARILYLPSVGCALLWAEIAGSVPNRKLAAVLFALVLLFQVTALLHNEQLWEPVAQTARQACRDAASYLKKDPKLKIYGLNLPRYRNGVYFLQNAFPYCVAINGSVDDKRIDFGNELPKIPVPDQHIAKWDEDASRLMIE